MLVQSDSMHALHPSSEMHRDEQSQQKRVLHVVHFRVLSTNLLVVHAKQFRVKMAIVGLVFVVVAGLGGCFLFVVRKYENERVSGVTFLLDD